MCRWRSCAHAWGAGFGYGPRRFQRANANGESHSRHHPQGKGANLTTARHLSHVTDAGPTMCEIQRCTMIIEVYDDHFAHFLSPVAARLARRDQ